MDASYQGKEIPGGVVNLFEKAASIGVANTTISFSDVITHPQNDGSNLLGDRFLFRGGR